jgi:integrase/recombinase XerD
MFDISARPGRLGTVALVAPPQASSDAELVALWIGCYRSRNTRDAYARDVARFLAFAAKPLRSMTLGEVQAFGRSIEGGMAPASAARVLSAVKSLIKFGHRLGYLLFDIAAPVQLPAIHDDLARRILTEWQVQRMLEMIRRPRDAAMLRLLYSAGLRVSELCGLSWKDMTARDEGGQVSVLGKGGKSREILVPASVWSRVIALRAGAGADDPVFRSRTGGRIVRSQVHYIVKRAAKRAGLPVSVSAHYFRHAHASHALDRGCPVHVLQATLGHASLVTTTRYSHARPGDSSARYLVA